MLSAHSLKHAQCMDLDQRLYELGARRVLVTGTGPLGCVPAELAMRGGRNGECSEELQSASSLYNPQLVEMITQLNNELGSDVFVAANTQLMHDDFVTDPQAYGNQCIRYIQTKHHFQ